MIIRITESYTFKLARPDDQPKTKDNTLVSWHPGHKTLFKLITNYITEFYIEINNTIVRIYDEFIMRCYINKQSTHSSTALKKQSVLISNLLSNIFYIFN